MGWNDRDYNRRRPVSHDGDFDRDHEDDDDRDDPEAPDPADQDDDDSPALIKCPHCRKTLVEDAEWCHHCGQFVEERPLAGRPAWVWVGIALALLVAAMMALR